MTNVDDHRRSGLLRKLCAPDEGYIMLTFLLTSDDAVPYGNWVETNRNEVHPSTIWRSLFRSGLYGRTAAKNVITLS
ncbi:hypothetical protein C0J50_10079 [Silurus asotus]|uniref:Uncharacterized protein n=1 Tax=Silurus asotus TaxID=30991 RepID=A0AAD4ZYE3_SILAS|nr:hypothetical protein C0J50_10079 [Silurus asotus]